MRNKKDPPDLHKAVCVVCNVHFIVEQIYGPNTTLYYRPTDPTSKNVVTVECPWCKAKYHAGAKAQQGSKER